MWAIAAIIFSSLFNLVVGCIIGAVFGYHAGVDEHEPKDKEQAKCDSES
jgi:hypothetical protein